LSSDNGAIHAHIVEIWPTIEPDEFKHVSYTGVDCIYWDEKGIKLQSPQHKFVYGDIYDLLFENHTFDLIIASHVLEHLEHLDTALSEIYRVAKKGAKILILVPLQGGRAFKLKSSPKLI